LLGPAHNHLWLAGACLVGRIGRSHTVIPCPRRPRRRGQSRRGVLDSGGLLISVCPLAVRQGKCTSSNAQRVMNGTNRYAAASTGLQWTGSSRTLRPFGHLRDESLHGLDFCTDEKHVGHVDLFVGRARRPNLQVPGAEAE